MSRPGVVENSNTHLVSELYSAAARIDEFMAFNLADALEIDVRRVDALLWVLDPKRAGRVGDMKAWEQARMLESAMASRNTSSISQDRTRSMLKATELNGKLSK